MSILEKLKGYITKKQKPMSSGFFPKRDYRAVMSAHEDEDEEEALIASTASSRSWYKARTYPPIPTGTTSTSIGTMTGTSIAYPWTGSDTPLDTSHSSSGNPVVKIEDYGEHSENFRYRIIVKIGDKVRETGLTENTARDVMVVVSSINSSIEDILGELKRENES